MRFSLTLAIAALAWGLALPVLGDVVPTRPGATVEHGFPWLPLTLIAVFVLALSFVEDVARRRHARHYAARLRLQQRFGGTRTSATQPTHTALS